jgi:peroxiredoxin|tara:strand:+ start:6987 stop:7160 length:174 start_codon:yes stop_codon:yes gene_type:complete
MVKEGNKAPDFRLKGVDEKGKEGEFSLNDFRGKKIILYFYPMELLLWESVQTASTLI